MRWMSAGVRGVLWATLIVGLAALFGPVGSVATFTDAHDGAGSITAADSFGGGGPPGGGVTADAGGPYTVQPGESVYMSAADSTTSRGNIDSYSWRLVSGPGGGAYWPSTPNARYDAPSNVQGPVQATVEVTVTTNQGNTAMDTATITITDGATAQTASSSARVSQSGPRRGGSPVAFGNSSG